MKIVILILASFSLFAAARKSYSDESGSSPSKERSKRHRFFISKKKLSFPCAARFCHRRHARLAHLNRKSVRHALRALKRHRKRSGWFQNNEGLRLKRHLRLVLIRKGRGTRRFKIETSRRKHHAICQRYHDLSSSSSNNSTIKISGSESSTTERSSADNDPRRTRKCDKKRHCSKKKRCQKNEASNRQ